MIRLAAATIVMAALVGSFALAQDSTPRVQVFGGYSLMHADIARPTGQAWDLSLQEPSGTFAPTSNFKGWSAEAQYNADRWVGVAADFGGQWGGPITASSGSGISGLPNANTYSFLAGPVLSYRNKSRMTPFVHALFGWDRASLSASTISGLSSPVSSPAKTYTDFAIALGGGLDFKISRHFALRAGQLDYFHTSLNFNKFYGSAFDSERFEGFATHQDNLRFSTGVVVSF